jgi:ADP-heptose:LPS heptosyltransferase
VSRTLVLSLLRAGDALVHLPALAALRAADPGGELHVLVQAAARPVVELLSAYAQVHRLPVDHQGGALGPCREVVEALRERRFDLVANLTHRPFAAELAEAVGGRRQLGLVRRGGGLAVSSPWLSALNDWGTSPATSVLHYGDVACQSLDLPRVDPRLAEHLPPAVAAWWAGAAARLGLDGSGPLVVLQLTTSEPKKTWPPERWAPFVRALAARLPGARVVALAAPAEQVAVASALAGTPAQVLSCSLPEAARLLAAAALLVTGDTALVHLAGLVGARVLLLSSGSSAFRELGPAGEGDLVLQADWPCAPCPHDPGCVAAASGYPCAGAVEPDALAELAATLAAGSPAVAPSAPGPRVALFRAGRDRRGLIDYRPLGTAPPDTGCAEVLREHLLAELPVAIAAGARPGPAPDRPRASSAAERAALAQLREAVGALRARAEGTDATGLARLVPALRSPFVLAVVAAVGARLREGERAALAGELARLAARVDAAG